MKDLLARTAQAASSYRATCKDRSVTPAQASLDALAVLDGPLPVNSTSPLEVIELMDRIGTPATTVSVGGRFFGFVKGGTLPAALAADWLVSAWDQNSAMEIEAHGVLRMERTALEWTKELLGLPAEAGGVFVTGATMANLTCLAAARHKLLADCGWDVNEQGLFGAPEIRVIVGEEAHVSVLKALRLLGFGLARLIRVAVDGQGRMRPQALPEFAGPTILCLQAGNVNTGACDPLAELCGKARTAKERVWVHIDGAFGLWAAAAPERAALVAGADQADSWATDAHKWLNVPYDCGVALVRDIQTLPPAMAINASYLQSGERLEPLHLTPEASRRARGVPVWAAVKSLGRSGVAEMVERCCRHAASFAEGLRAAGYEVLNEVVLNQVLVSFGEPEETLEVVQRLQAEGTCWCGSTVWQGRRAMRISVSDWATTDEDVTQSLEAMLRIAGEVRRAVP